MRFLGCIVLLASLAGRGHGLPAEKARTQVIGHIVGGEATDITVFPCMVSLQFRKSHICGATLLNDHYALTAAHCVKAMQDYYLGLFGDKACGVSICAGSTTLSECRYRYFADYIYRNPDYNSNTMANDCGLVYFATAIPQDPPRVLFCTIAVLDYDPAPGRLVDAAGWGAEKEGDSNLPDGLRNVTVPVVNKTECNAQYKNVSRSVDESSFCAGVPEGGKDTCQGDSGGGVYDPHDRVVGITSWGAGCARKGFPGVYARTGAPVCFNWITSKIQGPGPTTGGSDFADKLCKYLSS